MTTPARTVVDFARQQDASFRDSVVLADSALRRSRKHHRVKKAHLQQMLTFSHGWPGNKKAERVVEFATPRTDSALLLAAGYEVVHFGWHLALRAKHELVDRVRKAFARAARLRRT